MEELTGKVYGITIDPSTRKFIVSFLVDTGKVTDITKDILLRIAVKPFRKKRSLDANSYAWVLMTKIAEKTGVDKDSVYETMLQKYGYLWQDEDGNYFSFTIPADRDPEKVGIHAKCIRTSWVGEKEFKSYLAIKGSSEYDSREMSRFIDGIIMDCKDLGIETMTPEELKQMLERWNP